MPKNEYYPQGKLDVFDLGFASLQSVISKGERKVGKKSKNKPAQSNLPGEEPSGRILNNGWEKLMRTPLTNLMDSFPVENNE